MRLFGTAVGHLLPMLHRRVTAGTRDLPDSAKLRRTGRQLLCASQTTRPIGCCRARRVFESKSKRLHSHHLVGQQVRSTSKVLAFISSQDQLAAAEGLDSMLRLHAASDQ